MFVKFNKQTKIPPMQRGIKGVKMKKSMIVYIVTQLINNFIKSLDIKDLQIFLDNLIDNIENTIQTSDNKLDDSLLPGLRLVRELFNIPDFPDQ